MANETEELSSNMKDAVGIYFFVTFGIITLINIIGNVIVITIVYRHRPLHTPGNYFIVSLAFSDLLFAVFFPLYNLGQTPGSLFAKAFGSKRPCQTIIILVQWIEFNSAYHLVAITFTRYLAITRPLKYHIWLSEKTATISIVTLWLSTCIISTSMYASTDADTHLGICRFEVVYPKEHALFLAVVTMITPTVLMMILYAFIIRIARKQARCIVAMEIYPGMRTGKQKLFKKEMKSAMMVSLLVGIFVGTWSPLVIYIIYTTICRCSSHIFVRATFRLIVYINYAVNVFIYAGRMTEFRRYVKQDCWCFPGYKRRLSRIQCSTSY